MSGLSGWQHDILLKLQARDALDGCHAAVIEDYRRLAAQTAVLAQRNRSLLQAAASARSNATSTGAVNGSTLSNPVQQAYVASLEGQLSSLRDELSGLYKTHAQNAQRLVNLSEQLQGNADKHGQEHAELVQLRNERTTRDREREEMHHLRREKDKNIEHLQDEVAMLKLEFDMLEQRNAALQEDNASLLRRWLEKKAEEASAMDKMILDEQKKKKDSKEG